MNVMLETEKALRNNITADEWAYLAYVQTGIREKEEEYDDDGRNPEKA